MNGQCECRYILPEVPEVVHPPVPDVVLGNNSVDFNDILEEQDPEVTPGLFQGDMALTNEIYNYWRVGLNWDVFPSRLWKNGVVPYVISPLYGPSEYVTIYKALKTINFMTCIRFIPWDGKIKDYLLIWPVQEPKGCWSYVGRSGGAQILSLQPPDDTGHNCLGTEGRAIHELMHALGVFHEQSRWDRDKFVKIHTENIIPRYKANFDKQSLDNTTYTFEYDYNSIMHYGKYYFSKSKGKPTITPKKYDVKKIGQRQGMSKGDCLKLNDLYHCFDIPLLKRKYYMLCQFLGL
ncbi:discoidin cub egf laminin and zinc metalloprotease domain containing [Holotrichia oblita]|uniref:Discoidin cub egf laminin and zinc metalloprotease domain containing n=1 Tax=Holotrichia oblita TaxID=644536 RepID=A0ACB9TTH6_HOLOL|nr:discoidin cub egf laminin and zinc metalloprotease domain containing [Holotrichia oblita]